MTVWRRRMLVVVLLQRTSRFADPKKTIIIAAITSNDNGEELGGSLATWRWQCPEWLLQGQQQHRR